MSGGVLTLVRHGRPAISPWRWGGRAAFRRFLAAYDGVPVDPAWAPPGALTDGVNAAGVVFCSTAARARTSAELLLRDRLPVADSLFLEAAVASPPVPAVLPLPAWTALGRLAWLAGMGSSDLERRSEAHARAEAAADRLAEAVRRYGSAALIGHGWFNGMIGAALLARGWRGEAAGGHGYWSHRRFHAP